MSNRSRGPRWALLGVAAMVLAGVALLAFAGASIAPGSGPAVAGLTARDVIEVLTILALLGAVFSVPILVIAAFALPPRRDADPAWRRTLRLYTTTPALARRTAGDAATRACARMSDDALRVAAILPGHSESGRAAALAALAARGAALEPVPSVRVPSFYGPEDLPTARRAVATANRIRMTCAGIALLLLIAAIALIGVNMAAIEPVKARAAAAGFGADAIAALGDLHLEDVPARILAWPEMADVRLRDTIAKVCVGLMLPFALMFVLSSWLRARPIRILMLRKFNDARLGKVYNRLITNELQDFGHVIALADKHVRRSTLAWLGGTLMRGVQSVPSFVFTLATLPLLLLLRATDRTRWGPAFVAAPRDFRLLAKRLFDRLELNAETTFVSKGYLVRTSDSWWRLVVRLMMDSADVIVLDASYVTEGTAWEIDTLMQLDLWRRVVRLSLDGRLAQAQAALAHAPPGPIFTYDGAGTIADAAGFQDALFAALEQSVRARAS